MPQIFRFGAYRIYFWSNCTNNSNIPITDLKKVLRMIEANSGEIIRKWYDMFGEIEYFC